MRRKYSKSGAIAPTTSADQTNRVRRKGRTAATWAGVKGIPDSWQLLFYGSRERKDGIDIDRNVGSILERGLQAVRHLAVFRKPVFAVVAVSRRFDLEQLFRQLQHRHRHLLIVNRVSPAPIANNR